MQKRNYPFIGSPRSWWNIYRKIDKKKLCDSNGVECNSLIFSYKYLIPSG